MKNYFKYKKYLALTMLLAVSSSLFAVNFNEQRKVIIPQHSNAVYRDLTVLDTMDLSRDGSRTFLLELGKRPTYFWDSSKMFYLFQKQTLRVSDNLTVNKMNLGNSTSIFKGMRLGTVNLNKSKSKNMHPDSNDFYPSMITDGYSNLIVNYGTTSQPTELNVKLVIDNRLSDGTGKRVTHDLYTYNLETTSTGSYGTNLNIDTLRIAKLNVDGHIFPSPRSIMYYSETPFPFPPHYFEYAAGETALPANFQQHYVVKGTAREFELVKANNNNKPVKHYYGPWEPYPKNEAGYGSSVFIMDLDGSTYPWPGAYPSSDDLYKIYNYPPYNGDSQYQQAALNESYTHPYVDGYPVCGRGAGYQPLQPSENFYYDCDSGFFDNTFDNVWDHNYKSYRPCYEYHATGFAADPKPATEDYNNAGDYEFKVEEIYSVVGSSVTLISQNPIVRTQVYYTDQDPQAMPLLQGTVDGDTVSWELFEPNNIGYAFVNGGYQQLHGVMEGAATENGTENVCFKACDSQFCAGNKLVIRGGIPSPNNITHRVLKAENTPDNKWPDFEGPKQELHIFTYTLAYCPKQTVPDMQATYSFLDNYDPNNGMIFVNGYKVAVQNSMLYQSPQLPPTGEHPSGWTNVSTCVRRLVICNAFTNENDKKYYNRSFKLFSTDF